MPPAYRFLSWAIDFFLPRSCPLCQANLSYENAQVICNACKKSLEKTPPPWCPKCGKPFSSEVSLSHSPHHTCEDCQKNPPAFDSARAFGPYNGLLREMIHLMKYKGFTTLGSEFGLMLGHLAKREFKNPLPREEIVITFVPIDWVRWKERGFDQAKILAHQTAQQLGLDFMETLERKKTTPPQTNLPASRRRKNLKGVFSVRDPEAVSGKRILLLDDVLTTGSTASACARELKESGAISVDVLTICHTVLQPLLSSHTV